MKETTMTGENVLRRQEPQHKQPEVSAEVESLHVAAKMLEESVADLEGRLAPVLAERKMEVNGVGGSAPELVRVPLAEEIHSAGMSFQHVRDRIRSIVARLEI